MRLAVSVAYYALTDGYCQVQPTNEVTLTLSLVAELLIGMSLTASCYNGAVCTHLDVLTHFPGRGMHSAMAERIVIHYTASETDCGDCYRQKIS